MAIYAAVLWVVQPRRNRANPPRGPGKSSNEYLAPWESACVMTIMDPVTDHSRDIAAAMADPGLAHLHMGGAPVVIAAGSPPHVVYASASAHRLFGAPTLAGLTARLFNAAEPGSQRLTSLANGGILPARLERLRFTLGGHGEILTVQCRTMEAASGARLLVLAALGVRPALLRAAPPASAAPDMPAPPPAETPTPLHAVPSAEEQTERERVTRDALPPAESTVEPAPAAPPTAWETARELGRPVRFSWRSDAQDRITEFPEILAQAIGVSQAEILAQAWPSLSAHLAIDPENALAAALATRATFSAVETLWPVAGGGRMPVALGATPVAGADRAFAFYRGFGLIHPARIRAAPEPLAVPQATVDGSHPDTAHAHVPDVATQAGEDHLNETVPEAAVDGKTLPSDATGPAQAAFVVAPADQAALPEILPDAELDDVLDELPVHVPANANHQPELVVAPGDERFVPPVPGQLAGEGEYADDDDGEADESAAAALEPEALIPQDDAKIVRLRPLQGHLKLAAQTEKPVADKIAELPPAPLAGLRHVPAAHTLSNSERQAFSEIARSLTAKIKDTAPEILNPAAPAPVAAVPRLPALPIAELSALQPQPATELPQPVVAASAPEDGNLTHLFQRLPLGVLVIRQGETLFINPHLLDMLGYASTDAAAFRAGHGLDRMFRGRAPETLDPAIDGGTVPLVTQNGEVLVAEARLQAVDWDGAAASLLTLRRAPDHEVHARLQALELDVRQHEAEARELHAILDTATDGVAILDDNGLILSLNRSAEALFGYDQNEVAGEAFTVLVAPDQVHLANDYFQGIKTSGVASVLNDGREMLGRARQGRAIPLFMTLGRVGPGTHPKFCAILRDLTQWKKVEGELGDARREAERASQLKSDFLAKISHEIRTPLNAILGFAEVMSEERLGPVGNDRYKEYLRDIHRSGEHVMSLVNDLLDLSKIEAGKMELEFSSVDANKVVSECVSMMQPQAATERVVMRQSLAPRLPNIVADERALRQIVLNLLSNAVKFNEPGGQVIVSTALTDAGHAVIRIRDTGTGMSEADVLAALEPFKQLQTSRKQSGTGLGLPLTKALVEANRASFSIKSKKGEGTLVEVAFPPTRVLAE